MSVNEAVGQQSQLTAALDSGIEQISAQQHVTFTRYQKFALAADGFVFWVKTPDTTTVTGSLHYLTDRVQDDDQTIGSNPFLLTSEEEITQFNAVNPLTMWIGSWPIADSEPLQFAFASRGSYFREADIWHYSGFAVYPALRSQIVDSVADLPVGPIVSNSLPIWLAQNTMAPVYPSFLVPDNLTPPYIVAHVEATTALGAFPILGPYPGTIVPNSGAAPLHILAASQLTRDTVRLTLYGFDSQRATQFFVGLIEATMNGTAPFGFANSPSVNDAKRAQVEIAALAQKKTLDIEANYNQVDADAIARRLILAATLGSITIQGIHVVGSEHSREDEQRDRGAGVVEVEGPAQSRQDEQHA